VTQTLDNISRYLLWSYLSLAFVHCTASMIHHLLSRLFSGSRYFLAEGQLSASNQASVSFAKATIKQFENSYQGIDITDTTSRREICGDLFRAAFQELYTALDSDPQGTCSSNEQVTAVWLFNRHCSPQGNSLSMIPPMWTLIPIEFLVETLDTQDREKHLEHHESIDVQTDQPRITPEDNSWNSAEEITNHHFPELNLEVYPEQHDDDDELGQHNDDVDLDLENVDVGGGDDIKVDQPAPTFIFTQGAEEQTTVVGGDIKFTSEQIPEFFPDGLRFEIDDLGEYLLQSQVMEEGDIVSETGQNIRERIIKLLLLDVPQGGGDDDDVDDSHLTAPGREPDVVIKDYLLQKPEEVVALESDSVVHVDKADTDLPGRLNGIGDFLA